jgi:hypothetical protein
MEFEKDIDLLAKTNICKKLLNIINDNPNKKWDWEFISSNPNITWEIIEANLDLPWSWDYISQNPNITMEIIETNLDEP